MDFFCGKLAVPPQRSVSGRPFQKSGPRICYSTKNGFPITEINPSPTFRVFQRSTTLHHLEIVRRARLMASNARSFITNTDYDNRIAAIQTMDAESPGKVVPDSGATHNDKHDMHRMGKIQEFKVSHQFGLEKSKAEWV